MKLVNLGCGNKYHKDWINIDFVSNSECVLQHNLLDGIPLGDNEVDVVYHSHVLEHFSKKGGFQFIEECYRVMNKNAIIRIAVPDLEMIAKEYLRNLELAISGDIKATNDYEWIKLELFDQMVRNESGGEMKSYLFQPIIANEPYVFGRIGSEGRIIRESFLNNKTTSRSEYKHSKTTYFNLFLTKLKHIVARIRKKSPKNNLSASESNALKIGEFRLGGEIHQWMYDRYSLSKLLMDVGFGAIEVCTAFNSEIRNWEDYQLDVIDGEVRKPDSIFIEARKL
jgi:predicted SAM-dependent methyltransferase